VIDLREGVVSVTTRVRVRYMKILDTFTVLCGFRHVGCFTTHKLEVIVGFLFYILSNLFKDSTALEKLFRDFSGIFDGHEMPRRETRVHLTLDVVIFVNLSGFTFHSQQAITNISIFNEFDWNEIHLNLYIIDIFK
jgi:hypothetical protein